MEKGCFTALITPFKAGEVDYQELLRLVHFQIVNGVTGILAVGTTGESPTLSFEEHSNVVALIARKTEKKCKCIAGVGSNNTKESMLLAKDARSRECDAFLLVDPYYNGPSSLEIRREYIELIAAAFPEIEIIPYIIPGRTGTQLMPQDLAIAAYKYPNINSVKEATGSLDNMRLTRKLCGSEFLILSGDDGITFDMMTDPEIKGGGVISVMSNIVPKAMTDMVNFLNQGRVEEAAKINKALKPLFDIVTVTTEEQTPFGSVACKARNPLPIKTLMQILGMPSGSCRRPLGKMTINGFRSVINAARKVHKNNPEIFQPIEDFFYVDVSGRLGDNPIEIWNNLYYRYPE